VFIHKVDGDLFLSDDHKIDCQRDIQMHITEELNDANLDIHLSFYLTSIYDHRFEHPSPFSSHTNGPPAALRPLSEPQHLRGLLQGETIPAGTLTITHYNTL
jgi:hypothetical protein